MSERAKITAWLFLTSIGGSCGVDAVDAVDAVDGVDGVSGVSGVSGDLGSLARSALSRPESSSTISSRVNKKTKQHSAHFDAYGDRYSDTIPWNVIRRVVSRQRALIDQSSEVPVAEFQDRGPWRGRRPLSARPSARTIARRTACKSGCDRWPSDGRSKRRPPSSRTS